MKIAKYGPGASYTAGSESGTIDVTTAGGDYVKEDKNNSSAGNSEHFNKLKNHQYETAGDWLEALFQGWL